MVQKIDVNMPIDEARYIIIKSLDLRDEIGTLMIKDSPMLLKITERLFANILAAKVNGDGGIAAFELDAIDDICAVVDITKRIPYYMLLDIPEATAHKFCNAWLIFINTYHDTLIEKLHVLAPNGSAQFDDWYHAADEMQQEIDTIVHFLEMGISYLDLIRATSHLISEMKTWANARPTSLKLSEAYLQALNFYKEK